VIIAVRCFAVGRRPVGRPTQHDDNRHEDARDRHRVLRAVGRDRHRAGYGSSGQDDEPAEHQRREMTVDDIGVDAGRRGDDQQVHYRMRQRLMSVGDDFWIESDRGERVYKVDGKVLRLRKTLIFEDPSGRELAKIQEKVARIKDTMEVENPDGRTLATVKRALITPIRERWVVKIGDGLTSISRATSSTMNTPSPTGALPWPPCRSDGSGSPTRTAWKSHQARTRW
jgi:LURP-one-related